MRQSKRRASYGADDDDYDIGNAPDAEKHNSHRRSPSFDSNDDAPSSNDSSRGVSGAHQPMLSRPTRHRMKSIYFYRVPNRTVRWLCLILMASVVVFMLSLIRMSWASSRQVEASQFKEKPLPPPPWESFDFLERYFGGIRTLVPRAQNMPEYPRDADQPTSNDANPTLEARAIPSSTPYNPYPDFNSSTYKQEYGPVSECFLDAEETIRVPQVQMYSGVPQGQPDAVMGSYETVGLSNNMCFERYGRLGPYGFGYSVRRGGVGAGLEGERAGADDVWKIDREVDYTLVQWAEAQRRCSSKNSGRFQSLPELSTDDFTEMKVERADVLSTAATSLPAGTVTSNFTEQAGFAKLLPRTAVIIRTLHDFKYTSEDILYLRSLIAELSLLSGGEYTLHFLVHVKDDNIPIWADSDTHKRILENALPKEFQGMATLWSERQMGLIYGGLSESWYRDLPVHGVYRSTFMPIQYFAHKHPEYDFVWNWEMDVRYTGHWYHFFDTVRRWAKDQPRKGLWERNGRFYIPSVHGSWEDFKQMVRVQSEMPPPATKAVWTGPKPGSPNPGQAERVQPKPEVPIWGPLAPEDVYSPIDDMLPPTSYEKDKYSWGVGQEADLITFNPMFDPDETTWILSEDVTGYNTTESFPPRRIAVITASRLSRRLLDKMHKETALQRHTMFSEMWPASCALHHGLKAVYVPHPVFIDRDWPTKYLAAVMNGGKNGASGGARTSVFGDREHNFRGTTWYYNAGFSPNLWRRWLGYRVDNDGGEEEELAGEGRMCLPGILLHPVKGVELVVEGVRADGR
ncbi:hypothetical protein MMC19_001135 [Ptychographa xylographoides]|nr:hypothetical protein [Ptychographa xylographoides]